MPPDETAQAPRHRPPREPCLLLVWTARAPICEPVAFALPGQALTIGRQDGHRTFPHDDAMSSTHAAFIVEGDELVVRDFGSSSGTFVDGGRVRGAMRGSISRRHVIRMGSTIFVLEPDRDRVAERTNLVTDVPHDDPAVAGKGAHEAWAAAVAQLGGHEATLPPLHERPERIPFLMQLFANGLTDKPISATLVETCLRVNPWLGNIHALRDVMRRAVIHGHVLPDGTFDYAPAEVVKLVREFVPAGGRP